MYDYEYNGPTYSRNYVPLLRACAGQTREL